MYTVHYVTSYMYDLIFLLFFRSNWTGTITLSTLGMPSKRLLPSQQQCRGYVHVIRVQNIQAICIIGDVYAVSAMSVHVFFFADTTLI